MMKILPSFSLLLFITTIITRIHSFTLLFIHKSFTKSWYDKSSTILSMAKTYGPPSSFPSSSSSDDEKSIEELNQINAKEYQNQLYLFRNVINEIIDNIDKPDFLPRICTQNIQLFINIRGFDFVSICNTILDEAKKKKKKEKNSMNDNSDDDDNYDGDGDDSIIEKTEEAINYVVNFIETFVDEAKTLDDGNKALLGEIIKCIMGKTASLVEEIDINDIPSEMQREDNLNMFLEQNKDKFTSGFLRHLEGECMRIQSAPTNTPESMKLLQIIRMIQTRIVEELGKDLGEGAQVLGQLIGYELKEERMAVLQAGLTVRGVEFANELNALTMEALDGFTKVAGGADPELVMIIQEINDYIQDYIQRTNSDSFQ